jgi:hypothetical protein
MAANNPSGEKPLQTASFVVHATRGLIRDHGTRRKAMLIVLFAALLFIVIGSTLLQSVLDPRQHPGWFIFFWIVCAWLTMTAILLAVFDLLMVKTGAAKAKDALRSKMEAESSPPDSNG